MALDTRSKFQLEILTLNVISGIVYFHKIISERSRIVSETTPWLLTHEVQRYFTGSENHDDVIKWKHFPVTGPLCGEFNGEFPSQRPVAQIIDVFFDLRPMKRLGKRRWFETPSRSLWRHYNVCVAL